MTGPKQAREDAAPPTDGRRGNVDARGVGLDFDGVPALHNADLQVEGGEFFTLLGPSGSGKTTLLRIIAGLLEPTRGTVSIDGSDVTRVPTQRRDIGFVFQNYALFPHLTVGQNIEFGLKMRHVPPSQRARRVAEMIELVALGGYADRYPSQLSGGQQQRVALGRALAQRPRVLLLDEPLGALDRRLRQELGAEIRRIQKEAATTAIYVTHDQEEAFILSDRVGVMYGGLIHQVGTPEDLYRRPDDLFVARFLGETNLFEAEVIDQSPERTRVRVGPNIVDALGTSAVAQGESALLSVRPEQLIVVSRRIGSGAGASVMTPDSDHQKLTDATAAELRFLGQRTRLTLRAGDETYIADLDPAQVVPAAGENVSLYVRAASATLVKRGTSA